MVLVELWPHKMAKGGGGSAAGLLRRLAAWGYADVSHSGRVCDERWLNITKSIRRACSMCRFQLHNMRCPVRCTMLHVVRRQQNSCQHAAAAA